VALLNRLNGHLDDSALADAWVDARLDTGAPAHPHLAGCAACRARLEALADWLEAVRADAAAEADAAFPAERLATQHAQIMRRIDAAGRPAKVIAFPKIAAPIATGTSSVRRWVASAAAAGLIAGIALGNYMDLRHPVTPGRALPPETVIGNTLQPQPGAIGTGAISDEELMWHLEELAGSSMPESLLAFDSLTPRARDYPR
jgi:hypothetical protein